MNLQEMHDDCTIPRCSLDVESCLKMVASGIVKAFALYVAVTLS